MVQKAKGNLTRLIFIITILGILFRLYLLVEFNPGCCGSDEGVYNALAKNIIQQGEFVITQADDHYQWRNKIYGAKPPLYPYFLAAIYRVIGNSPMVAKVIQIFLSALTGFLIYSIGKRCLSREAGIMSLVIYSFFWETAFMSISHLSENLYWLLLSFLIFVLIRKDHLSDFSAILAGITLGLLALTKAASLNLIVPVIGWIIWKNPRLITAKTIMIVVFFWGIAMSPWIIRNYQIYNALVPIYTDGGINFWMGNYPNSGGSYNVPKADDLSQTPILMKDGVEQEIERDNFYYSQAINYMKRDPLQAIDTDLRKVFMTFTTYRPYVLNMVSLRGKWLLVRPKLIGLTSALEFVVSYEFAAFSLAFFISVAILFYEVGEKVFRRNVRDNVLMSKGLNSSYLLILLLFGWHLLNIAISHYEPRYITQLYPLMIPIATLFVFKVCNDIR